MTTQYLITKRETCPVCDGRGVISDPHCKACGTRIPGGDIWWTMPWDKAQTLPCGCAFRNFIEEYTCSRCEGTRYIETQVDLTEALAALGVLVQT